jgi:DNA-binding MarR family transcriptional regulator
MTAGNLSTHLRKLEDAGYITQEKVIEGRSPATYLGITPVGVAAFDTYKKQLMELL